MTRYIHAGAGAGEMRVLRGGASGQGGWCLREAPDRGSRQSEAGEGLEGGLGQAAGAWALLESWAGAGMPPQPRCLGWGSEAGGPSEGREERKSEGVPSS